MKERIVIEPLVHSARQLRDLGLLCRHECSQKRGDSVASGSAAPLRRTGPTVATSTSTLMASTRSKVGWHADNEKLFQGKFRDCRIISLSLGHPCNA
eukprot:998363-Amphidinium_carterae.1